MTSSRKSGNRGARLISENEDFVVIAPFAPRFPFETWILPKAHDSFYEDGQKREYVNLARSLRDTLLRIEKSLSHPPYNFIIHNTPFHENQRDSYHWHLEIMPKLTRVAGFEWGTGFYINPTPPEDSAKFMREIDLTP